MKEFFAKNSVLKVISFLVALILWFYIIIIVDPPVTMSIDNVPIKYVSQESLTEQNLAVDSISEEYVDVKISGSRNKIADIDKNDILATVNLEGISGVGERNVAVNLSIPYESSVTISKQTPSAVNVIVEKMTSETKRVLVNKIGQVADEYIYGTIIAEPSKVILKGSETLLAQISSVCVDLDFNGENEDIEIESSLYFTGKNGKKIPKDDIIYQNVIVNTDFVKVICPVKKVKEVPVELSLETSSKKNYETNPGTVSIYSEDPDFDLEAIEAIYTVPVDRSSLANGLVVSLVIPEGVKIKGNIQNVSLIKK